MPCRWPVAGLVPVLPLWVVALRTDVPYSPPLLLELVSIGAQAPQEGALKLEDEWLSVYVSCSNVKDPLDPTSADCPGQAPDFSLQVCTLSVETLLDVETANTSCSLLMGCKHATCRDGPMHVRLCTAHQESDLLQPWKTVMDDANLKCNQVEERLPSEIQHAVHKLTLATTGTDPGIAGSSEMPSVFSPITRNDSTELPAGLQAVVISFMSGPVIRFRAGANSRSGASFFMSSDKAFMAKRVRSHELEQLWNLGRDGEYATLYSAGTLLNTIYLGLKAVFRKGTTTYWIVMKREALPNPMSRIGSFIRPKTFFLDVKPSPLVSDRVYAMQMLLMAQFERSFIFEHVPSWRPLLGRLEREVDFLAKKNVIDYSLFLYGSYFDVNASDDFKYHHELMQWTANDEPKCVFACQDRSKSTRQFVDASAAFGDKKNRLTLGEDSFKCCCVEDPLAAEAMPCVVVKLWNTGLYFERDACKNLVAPGWNSYWRTKNKMLTGGRCLLNPQENPPMRLLNMDDEKRQALTPHLLEVAAIPGIVVPKPLALSCASLCVAIADYLLPFNSWNQFENRLLSVWYGGLKWSDYAAKVKKLMACIGRPFSESGPQCLSNDEREKVYDDIVSGVFADLVVNKM